jgi:dTDP-4-amino-4,6-dideoxy-D-galactose acyltransferase
MPVKSFMPVKSPMSHNGPAPDSTVFYSPLSFLRPHQPALSATFYASLQEGQSNAPQRFSTADNPDTVIYYRALDWDSNYFGVPTFRIEFINVVAGRSDSTATVHAFVDFIRAQHAAFYIFAEVPSEDVKVLQALSGAAWRLIETRLTYYRNDADKHSEPRHAVRCATVADIDNLRQCASLARNDFDRFHADPFFSTELADAFLSTFIENSVKGFADIVLVPESAPGEPDAFLTGNMDKAGSAVVGQNIGRMVLSAVGQARRGWYVRLISELTYWFVERNVRTIYMTTQSTNRAVIRVWEKLGYSFGRSTHVLAISAGRAKNKD